MFKIALLRTSSKTSIFSFFPLYSQLNNAKTLFILFALLLTSCSSQQESITTEPTDALVEINELEVDSNSMTASQHLALAKSLAEDADAATAELITATKLFYQEKNYLKALWLADKTLLLIDEKTSSAMSETMQLSLIKISSLQHLGKYQESLQQLEQLEVFAKNKGVRLSATFYRLLYLAYNEQQQPISAVTAQLYANSVETTQPNKTDDIESIWKNLQTLSQWQLQLLTSEKAPNSDGWIKLTQLANKYGATQNQMRYQVKKWQRKYKKHPANLIAKQLFDQELNVNEIQNIAVLLPLSGKNNSVGLALQQGILAGYTNDDTKKLHFYDSNKLNWYGLTNELATNKIDFVIGPLLKANVDKYIQHTSVEAQQQNNHLNDQFSNNVNLFSTNLPATDLNNVNTTFTATGNNDNHFNSDNSLTDPLTDFSASSELNLIETLFLNTPTNENLASHHAVLSMRPEVEAIQAATTLSKQNFQRPIVLSQRSVVSKRIAQAFANEWQQMTGEAIQVSYYDTGAQMQQSIKASLSVDKSNARIAKLKSRLNQSIKTQSRNRRDIDMIYLVGNPEQTRLVKPYIEVNISPFANAIPVYASSRSHSSISDYSSYSDLSGLTFTEIPWFLTSEQDTELAQQSTELWPNRSDGFSRLFAMGFDSYQLITKIPLMKQAPYIQHWGQTGVLKLDQNNTLTRSLTWGKYESNKVVTVAME